MKQCMYCRDEVESLCVSSCGLYICTKCSREEEEDELREWYFSQVL